MGRFAREGKRYGHYAKNSLYIFLISMIAFFILSAINTGGSVVLYYLTLFALFLTFASGVESAILFILSKVFH